MLIYYWGFVPNLAAVLTPLHASITSAGKAKAISWSPEGQKAFDSSKASLTDTTLLHHPSPFAATILSFDACELTVGLELAQPRQDQQPRPIFFLFSHWD